jgi:hypothetical protein
MAAVCVASGTQDALATDPATTPSAGSATSTTQTELVRKWRAHVTAMRVVAVRNAWRIGVRPYNRAYERYTIDIGFMRWLYRAWSLKNQAWVLQFRRIAPKLMCIHYREGSWTAYNPAGYYGGLQMDRSFMWTYGWDKMYKYHGRDARYWLPRDQLAVGFRAVRHRGFWPWPNTARACGLL